MKEKFLNYRRTMAVLFRKMDLGMATTAKA